MTNKQDNMNIVFSINKNYINLLCISITSLLENNHNRQINIYILHAALNSKNQKKIKRLEKFYNNLKIYFILIDKNNFKNFKLNIKYISLETYFRFLIPDILQENKCLYLDADTLTIKNLSELYNTDISEYYCAGCNDLFIEHIDYKKEIGLSKEDLYINAGVILFNLEKMRENKIADLLLHNTEKYSNIIKYQDQDILNITCKNHILKLDSIYNYTSFCMEKEKDKANNVAILHYTGSAKPWKFKYKGKFKNPWLFYKRKYKNLSCNKIYCFFKELYHQLTN